MGIPNGNAEGNHERSKYICCETCIGERATTIGEKPSTRKRAEIGGGSLSP